MAERRKLNLPRPELQWQGPYENWARAWVNRNFWRVQHLFGSKEDAMQECALIFCRCIKYYEKTVHNPAWMMSLFQRAVINEWNTHSVKDAQQRALMRDDRALALISEHERNAGPMLVSISEYPDELVALLRIIADAPAEVVQTLFDPPVQLSEKGAFTKSVGTAVWKRSIIRRLRKALGINDPAVDIMSELLAFIS